jgi:hypothetical protein
MALIGRQSVGRSMLLAELARDILESDDTLLPVLVDIATWPDGRRASEVTRPFTGWLLARLTERYGIEPDTALRLIADHRMVLLFDGFDRFTEREERRGYAVMEEFRAAYGNPPVALTSRAVFPDIAADIERVYVDLP